MIPVRQDRSARDLRRAAQSERGGKIVRRLLGIAHVLDGRGREESATLVGLAPQSLARAIKRYNAEGIPGLKDRTIPGRPPRLTSEQAVELKRIMLARHDGRQGAHAKFTVREVVELIEQKWGARISAEAVRTKLHSMHLK